MTKPSRAARRPSGPERIVGLGCSAGGLEACEQFLTHLAPDTGLAFVLVSHLDPDRKGIMPELLQRCTRMKVCQAEDGMKARPNCVYVIPPKVDLSVLHGKFQLLEPSAPRGLRLPIDFFFKHLAQDQKERSVGIILSGMGTDGTQGLKAIKEGMGLVLAQEPASAKYDGMPRSAIGTGLVDIVAPAMELPARLAGFVKHAAALPHQAVAGETEPSSALEKVFVLLRARTGTDFSAYKATTIHRRLERRLNVHQLESLAHYVRYAQENPQELDLLFRELLIGVTSFFRDPAAYQVLQEKAIPQLLESKAPGSPLRVWVPGCATGEEAYSVMLALTECLDQRRGHDAWPIQMFATDLNKEAIDHARQGVFPANIAAEVSPERLRRFFVQSEHGYTIKKAIRERIVFAPHNLLTDPPFTKLDLLCCRNLLIYLKAEWQKRLMAVFHYALNPGPCCSWVRPRPSAGWPTSMLRWITARGFSQPKPHRLGRGRSSSCPARAGSRSPTRPRALPGPLLLNVSRWPRRRSGSCWRPSFRPPWSSTRRAISSMWWGSPGSTWSRPPARRT
jgi:chemotaxis methyl-accepting protein methylase